MGIAILTIFPPMNIWPPVQQASHLLSRNTEKLF